MTFRVINDNGVKKIQGISRYHRDTIERIEDEKWGTVTRFQWESTGREVILTPIKRRELEGLFIKLRSGKPNA